MFHGKIDRLQLPDPPQSKKKWTGATSIDAGFLTDSDIEQKIKLSDRALATRRQLMNPYHWTIHDKQTDEKLDSGTDWADNQKDLTDSVLKPAITALYKSADEVKVSVRKIRN